MQANMGSIDRVIRLAVAVIIAALWFSEKLTGTAGLILLALAAIFAVTGFVRFCPLYLPFGISTRRG